MDISWLNHVLLIFGKPEALITLFKDPILNLDEVKTCSCTHLSLNLTAPAFKTDRLSLLFKDSYVARAESCVMPLRMASKIGLSVPPALDLLRRHLTIKSHRDLLTFRNANRIDRVVSILTIQFLDYYWRTSSLLLR
jgi:hypothetical protein